MMKSGLDYKRNDEFAIAWALWIRHAGCTPYKEDATLMMEKEDSYDRR